MSCRNLAILERFLHGFGEAEEAQGVGDGRALLAHAQGHGLLGEAALVDQPLETQGSLDGVEVLALDVFHDGQLEHGHVVGLADVGRDLGQAGHAGGAVAPFAADDLVAGRSGLPQRERLDDAQGADRVGEFGQRFGIEAFARLVGVGDDLVERDARYSGEVPGGDPVDAPGLFQGVFAQQRAEASS